MMKSRENKSDGSGLWPAVVIMGLVLIGLVVVGDVQESEILFALVVSVGALIVAGFMAKQLLAKDKGPAAMIEIATAIKEGSNGFFKTQYKTIAIIACLTATSLFMAFSTRDPHGNVPSITMAGIVTASFLLGAACSCAAGYIGLWVSVRANLRVAAAARHSYIDPIRIALAGGAVAAVVVVALVVLGITFLYIVLETMFVGVGKPLADAGEVPMLMVGFGFGASFVAMFAQLGGGIFTKAADVGADLVGKVEVGIPEDDPRNPAVVADLVGDNVGDCAGRGADLFESIAAEMIAAMILGAALSGTNIEASELRGFVLFPLVVHAFDLVVSLGGVFFVLTTQTGKGDHNTFGDPLQVLKKGYLAAGLLAILGFGASCFLLLNPVAAPNAWRHFFACGFSGMMAGWISVFITQYYTDTHYRPVKSIGESSTTGHATNIITGISVGLESTAAPTIVVSAAILASYWLGNSSGLTLASGEPTGGLFGTAVATMGMLSTAVYVLAMDFFGPIADNAGGIVEMSDQPESVRNITDMLDAVGNTTKAATKGFAIGSAALACFLLFTAFQDEVEAYSGVKLQGIDITQPEIFVAGLMGAMLVFLFSAFTIKAVGTAAQCVVEEVRRQFRDYPGIMTGEQKPDYRACVALVTQESLRLMLRPGLLAVGFPLLIGVVFRKFGNSIGDPLLGAKAVLSMLVMATVTGILMSLFFNNAGGAWDNAKKLIETGKHGGKGSEAHKAAVTGDTVGDPFKDTAGPSLHVLIKLLSTVALVFCPLFVTKSAGVV